VFGSRAARTDLRYLHPVPRPYVFDGVADGPAPDAVVYDFGRLGWRSVFVTGAAGFFFGGSALAYVIAPEAVAVGGHATTIERVIAGFFAVVFLLVGLFGVLSMPAITRKYFGMAVDGRGLWWRDKSDGLLYQLPWQEIRAVSSSAARAARTGQPGGTTSVASYVSIYFADPHIVSRYPDLKRARGYISLIPEGGPPSNPSRLRLRVQLMPFTNLPRKIRSAVGRFAPQLWA
jgi:hypothetical protein